MAETSAAAARSLDHFLSVGKTVQSNEAAKDLIRAATAEPGILAFQELRYRSSLARSLLFPTLRRPRRLTDHHVSPSHSPSLLSLSTHPFLSSFAATFRQ